MGSAASMPAARAAAWEPGITHAQRVTRLYRTALRTCRDWVIDYDLWIHESLKIQARFQANKNASLVEGERLVQEGMTELFESRHPDPYIPIYKEGSSKFQRNVPPPPEVRKRSERTAQTFLLEILSPRLQYGADQVNFLSFRHFMCLSRLMPPPPLFFLFSSRRLAHRTIYASTRALHKVEYAGFNFFPIFLDPESRSSIPKRRLDWRSSVREIFDEFYLIHMRISCVFAVETFAFYVQKQVWHRLYQ